MNPYNDPILTKSRQVKHCPPHFVKVVISPGEKERTFNLVDDSRNIEEQVIRDWLHQNIEHRFFLGRDADVNKSFFVEALIAAFENPRDATLFSLTLDSLV